MRKEQSTRARQMPGPYRAIQRREAAAINQAPAEHPRTGRLLFFMSYRFNPSSERASEKLRKFFRELDVELVTGDEYEPRSVSEKIRSRLDLPLDCVVLLVVGEESFWTRDEIGIAKAKGIPVIPLVSYETEFDAGVFGDLEFIRFEHDHVEQTFIRLLEALRYIRLHPRSMAVS